VSAAEYVANPTIPFFLWLRLLTGERLVMVHRFHLSTQMRDAGQEVSLHRGALPQATSASLAAQLLGRLTSPTRAAIRVDEMAIGQWHSYRVVVSDLLLGGPSGSAARTARRRVRTCSTPGWAPRKRPKIEASRPNRAVSQQRHPGRGTPDAARTGWCHAPLPE
jgi:hypothetical protein